jgi:hypothetical protein
MLRLLSRIVRTWQEERMISTLVSEVEFNVLNDFLFARVRVQSINLLIGLLLQVRLIVQIIFDCSCFLS